MVVLLARCKNEEAALEAQGRIIAACPSLIFTRILRKLGDLDSFDAHVLRSGDDSMVVGLLAYEHDSRRLTRLRRVRSLATLAASLSGIAFAWHSFVDSAAGPVAERLLIGVIFTASTTLVLWVSMRLRMIPEIARQMWKVERWLRAGRFVTLAAAEDPPDDRAARLVDIEYFDQPSSIGKGMPFAPDSSHETGSSRSHAVR